MLAYGPMVNRIKSLLAEGRDSSVIYAALEARLALEKVCYDRLLHRYDYISHYELLRKWQPGGVINVLMNEVDPYVGETLTLHIGKSPARTGVKPEEEDYAKIGTQIGFDRKRLVKLWNALGKLALHVRLPESKADEIEEYGDTAATRQKVEEVLEELERLSEASLALSGFGEQVSWDCLGCGQKNKRRSGLLREGQSVYCINSECDGSWKVRKDSDQLAFEPETADFTCQGCGDVKHLPWRFFIKMKYDQTAIILCEGCGHKNHAQWRLTQVRRVAPGEGSS